MNLPILFLNVQSDLDYWDNFSDQMYHRNVRDKDAHSSSAAIDCDPRNRTVAESHLKDVDQNPRVAEFLSRAVDRNSEVAALPLGDVDPARRVLR